MPTREELLARAQLLQKASSIQKSRPNLGAEIQPEAYAEIPQAAASMLQGFGNQATLGHLPQLNAAVEPAAAGIADLVTGGNSSETTPDYVARRDSWIKQQLDAKKASPRAYLAGQLGGGLATAEAMPIAAAETIPGQMLSGAASMAAQSALQNPGDQPGVVDPLQLEARGEAASDKRNLIGAAAPLAGPILGKSGDLLGKLSKRRAFGALGPYAREVTKALGKDAIEPIGQTALETGLISFPPRGYEALSKRAGRMADTAGADLGQTVEQMAQKETGDPVSLNREEIANNIANKLQSTGNEDVAGVADKNGQLQKMLENWKTGGAPGEAVTEVNPNIPLLQAELKKRAVNKEINWDRLPNDKGPLEEQFNRALSGELKGGVEKGGEELAAKTGFPLQEFKNQKQTFGNLQTAQQLLDKRQARDFANRMISPSDYGAAATGAMLGRMNSSPGETFKHTMLGAGLGLVNHVGRKYGNQLSAVGMNRLGQLVDATGRVVPEAANVTSRSGIWNMLLNQNKENP